MRVLKLITCAAYIAGASPGLTSAELLGGDEASLILTGGKIHVAGAVVEAMAVDATGVIIATGSATDIGRHKGDDSKVIDLAGRSVLPGFHDLHVHPAYAGLNAAACVVPQGATLAELLALVKACVDKARPGEWVIGGQWDASAIGGVPTRQMLDEVSPDNPVLLTATSGHSSWVNTKALQVADITRDTPDPEGGIIERDADGNPAGVLREYAAGLVRSHIPPPTADDVRAAIKWSLHKMLSYGITSFTEASAWPAAVEAYAALADENILKQRARLCLRWYESNTSAEAMIDSRNLYARDRVATDCVKIMLDGVPTDSHTAAMLAPYSGNIEGRKDEASLKGLLMVDPKTLNSLTTNFDRQGLTVKFHAAGDAAVRAGLDAIEAARDANGFSGLLHNVGHCTFVAQSDILRARKIAATFEVSPYLWAPSPINDSITAAIGDDRMDRIWPVREMLEAGALVVPGSDWSVVPSVNPWIGIETLITRETPGDGSGKSFGKGEAITLDQAIAMYTINSARHVGTAHKLGRIEEGMLADVIVVDQDPYEVPLRDLHKTNVMMTIINGEIVYTR